MPPREQRLPTQCATNGAAPVRAHAARTALNALREARRGSAAGLSGMRAEHFKLLLHDLEALELLAAAATHLAQAHSWPSPRWRGQLRCASGIAERGGLQQATFSAASFPGSSRRAGLTHSIMQPVPSSMRCRPARAQTHWPPRLALRHPCDPVPC